MSEDVKNRVNQAEARSGQQSLSAGRQAAAEQPPVSESEQMQIRRQKLEKLQAEGQDPFEQLRYPVSHHAAQVVADFAQLEGRRVSLAGRLMSKRGMGKVSFCDLADRSGSIQLFTKVDQLGEERYARWQSLDIGDWVGVEGEVMRTQRGEISIRTQDFSLLAKTLRPLPEKYHGLKDTDTRYRQRYLDLVMNPEVKEAFTRRSLIIRSIRNFLDARDFLEVETPILNVIPGGATARPFITHHNALDIDLYLRIAPELYLKRLIVGGMERVYELGRQFRNEGLSVRHNPEFTLLELYQAYTDYKGMMEITEQLIAHCADQVLGERRQTWQGVELNLEPPFRRLSMRDAVLEACGVDFYAVADDAEAFALAEAHGIAREASWHKGDVFNAFFERYCEEKLIQPTFIYDYPIEVSPLTKKKPGRPDITERFELFICGKEFANAYSELNNPIDQRERFAMQLAKREAGDEEANFMDEDFCVALEYGMPPTGGMGMGIDRLCMMLSDQASIRDVLLFPTMKPLDGAKREGGQGAEAGKAPEAPQSEPERIDFSQVEIEPLFTGVVDFATFSKSDFRAVKVLDCEAVPKSKKLLKFTLDDGSGENRTILSGIREYYEPEALIGKTCVAITNLPPRAMMGLESRGMLISAVHREAGEERLNLLMLDEHIPAGAKLY